ncbi:MAG: hypothetical protein H6581_25580 [Bacteroidia bacterium]|nr:hypothetical protein [Bacteroidia bacterium]
MQKTKTLLLLLLVFAAFSCEKIQPAALSPVPEPEFLLSFQSGGHTYQFTDQNTSPTRMINAATGHWSETTSWTDPATGRTFGITLSPTEPLQSSLCIASPHNSLRHNLFSMTPYHTHTNLPQPALLTLWYVDEWGQKWTGTPESGGNGVLAFSTLRKTENAPYHLFGEGVFIATLTFQDKTMTVSHGQFKGKFLLRSQK